MISYYRIQNPSFEENKQTAMTDLRLVATKLHVTLGREVPTAALQTTSRMLPKGRLAPPGILWLLPDASSSALSFLS